MTEQPATPLTELISELRWGLGAHATNTSDLYAAGEAETWEKFAKRNPTLAAKVRNIYDEFVKLRDTPDGREPWAIEYHAENFDRWLAEAAYDEGIHRAITAERFRAARGLFNSGQPPTPHDLAILAHKRRNQLPAEEAK